MNATRPPPPPAGAPPSYNMITRVYSKNLRPILLTTISISIVYSALWAGSALSDISDAKKIKSIVGILELVIGILYVAVLASELFGLFATLKQNPRLVRTYCYASVGIALAVSAAEILRIVIHFAFKNAIISTCEANTQLDESSCNGPYCVDGPPLTADQADQYCHRIWNRRAFTDVAWFIAASIFSFLFANVAFGYYRQLMSVGTRIDQPQDHIRMQTYATTQQQQGYQPRYDPPQYPPPEGAELGKVPDYEKGDYDFSYTEKAPGYETAVAGSGSSTRKKSIDDDDDLGAHGPRVQGYNNPFRDPQ